MVQLNAGHLLSDTLHKFGITQADLAKASGIPPNRISDFRMGKHDITLGSLQKILVALPAPARFYFLGLLVDSAESFNPHEKAA